jgi:thiol-disulfide isomerase/thioredoxin
MLLGASFVAMLGAAVLALFLWMLSPAADREVRAACAGMRSSPPNAALCPAGQESCSFPIPAPDFTVTDRAGKPVKLSSFRGKVVLLNFWASWCGVCKMEKPAIERMASEMANDDFEVVALASDREWAKVLVAIVVALDPNAAMVDGSGKPLGDSPTLKSALELYGRVLPDGVPFQVYLDSPEGDDNIGKVAASWGIKAVPESFLVDRQGNLRAYFVNKRDWDSGIAETCIQSVIDE